jgi:hypothetical protein
VAAVRRSVGARRVGWQTAVIGTGLVAACVTQSHRPSALSPPNQPQHREVAVALPLAPSARAGEVLRRKGSDELAAIQRELQSCDEQYFSGRLAPARDCFLAAWEKHHPNPLALVMAAHAAARDLGTPRTAPGRLEPGGTAHFAH